MSSPPAEIAVRRMIPADLPRVLEIAEALEYAPHYPHSTWLGVLDPQAAPPRLALVAEDRSAQVQGFVVASQLPAQAELETIAVAPASQRRGIARCLLQSLMEELGPAGIHEVWLEVRVSNAPAVALYRSLGFRETGRRPRYYADPVEDALLMGLQWS
jgi:[ribosomal protein S18]-alanine N-acetyltransferase